MSGLFLGRTALILLIPAVVVFGIFMFGAGFFSGNFYTERVPPETIIRHEGPVRSDTLTNLAQQPAQSGQEQVHAEAESMAQTTGSLETGQAAGQGSAPQTAQPETAPATPAEQAQIPEELDPAARERALAELRAGQTDQERIAAQQQDAESPAPVPAAETPAPPVGGGQPFTFQVGAFLEQTNAAELAATLISRGYEAWVVSHRDGQDRLWHAVRVGRYRDRGEAESAAAAFRQREGVNAVPVPLEQGNATQAERAAPSAAPQQPKKPLFVVYVGAYRNAQAAREAARPLLEQGYVPCVASILDSQHQTWHIVEVVEFPSRAEAETFMIQNAERPGAPALKLREIQPGAIIDKHCF